MSWIEKEVSWLTNLIEKRVEHYFSEEHTPFSFSPLELEECFYKKFLEKYSLSIEERVIVALALCAELFPEALDLLLSKNKLYDKSFTEFGGVINSKFNTFTPTIKTAVFLLAGDDKRKQLEVLELFSNDAKLFKESILVEKQEEGGKFINRLLLIDDNTLNKILKGKEKNYEHTSNFPASKLTTNYDWSDLVLGKHTAEHLEELELWLNYKDTLLEEWSMKKAIKRGYKALFYGPPGTGKTLTASLLGKKFDKDVYRIDLSQIVSKYIGETEKNLEQIFKVAENKDWILFFDEADSLFGKRTNISSSNDKYANQETAYLLQKVEESSCLIILATNLKDNFDEAFLRRFQSAIYFPIPDEKERKKLWENGFSNKADLSSIELDSIAYKYELTGANIINIVRYASLMAIKENRNVINNEDIITGIRREKFKEGKII